VFLVNRSLGEAAPVTIDFARGQSGQGHTRTAGDARIQSR
jgi:hypothetical protein